MTTSLYMLVRKEIGFWEDGLTLYVYTKDMMNPSMIGIAQPLVFDWQPAGGITPSQAVVGGFNMESATRLMDSLWEAGIRPSRIETVDRQAEINALKQHIEDLKKLLWNRVGIEAQ